jgi:hypothetical protein
MNVILICWYLVKHRENFNLHPAALRYNSIRTHEFWGSKKGGEFLDDLSDHQLLKIVSPP